MRSIWLFACATAVAAALAPVQAGATPVDLNIGSPHGTLSFAIGSSALFRITGGFDSWRGTAHVDEDHPERSTVDVTVDAESVSMADRQEAATVRGPDFFNAATYPALAFHSDHMTRTSATSWQVDGRMTLRGITRPMTFEVTVRDRDIGAAPGAHYARLEAHGTLQRSQFGMDRYVDLLGDPVKITIDSYAWR
ncbi:YceI family protein [Reyranella sp.]|uniref:YceI family protein n=1 Tax=Reyranella sp. TaxID=1929291 RepID=UPI003D0E2236